MIGIPGGSQQTWQNQRSGPLPSNVDDVLNDFSEPQRRRNLLWIGTE
jgi:hypothetical protein